MSSTTEDRALASASALSTGGSGSSELATPIRVAAQPQPVRQRKPRRPQPKNAIIASVFRPHVLADERLLLWTSPHGLAYNNFTLSKVKKDFGTLDCLVNAAGVGGGGPLVDCGRDTIQKIIDVNVSRAAVGLTFGPFIEQFD